MLRALPFVVGATSLGAASAAVVAAEHGRGALLPSAAADLASRIGTSHWQPCYYMNASLPSTVDGAVAFAGTGSSILKLNLGGASAYAWNSPEWPPNGFSSLKDAAAHPYYADIFSNSYGTAYSSFILVAFSQGPQYHGDICKSYTASDAAEDTRQFHDLTAYLMAQYAGRGYRFVLQSWENDWATRCGSYNANQKADPAVLARYALLQQARQAGVTAGRVTYCRQQFSGSGAGIDCEDPASAHAVHAAGGVEVYHAAEVNLVKASMDSGFPNVVLEVLPHVPLDMVSYSSYDTQALPLLGQALDFIAAHHNRTAASPPVAVAIGEYGTPENQSPVGTVQNRTVNVMTYAFSANSQGLPRAAYAMFWELMDNTAPQLPGQRCTRKTGPVFDPKQLAGFWLVKPTGEKAWGWGYLQGLINGSIPLPVPPSADSSNEAQ